jgi:release factor glutamine methyltransferase
LAILQVNLRPASKSRRALDSQRREAESHHSLPVQNGNAAGAGSTAGGAAPIQPADPPALQRIVWTLAPYTTVGRAIVSATQRLTEAGSDTPHLDAQVALAHILGVDRSWLFAHYDYELTPTETTLYTELVARRATAEPVAYLIGHREFYGLDLSVDYRVLIPRPETELLVDAALDHIQSRPNKAVRMVDVGTGSGAIAIAVAANTTEAQIYAIDLSPDALEVAAANVARHGLQSRVTLLQGDLLDPLPENVDIIAANLPYIASPEYAALAPGVRDYEPQLALEAGPEGLDAIRRLLEDAPFHLNPGGVLFLEIGHNQGEAVVELANTLLPATYVALHQDYHGLDRLVVVAI